MDIKVSLPKPEDTCGKDIKAFLRQLELCVHHLQKSVEQLEKDELLTEDTFIIFRFPYLEKMIEDKNSMLHIHIDDISDTQKMQDIEIEIATA